MKNPNRLSRTTDSEPYDLPRRISRGLLIRFVGMLTESHSFMSFPRHEDFRRVPCNILGTEVEQALLPNDGKLLTHLVTAVCHRNAQTYFGFPPHSKT